MSKRNRREHGRIISVETLTRGDALAADVAAGATSITVNDAGDFDEDGGWLFIGAQTVEYTACDDDTGIITLADPLTAAGEQGDPVHVWSDLYDEVVDYQLALVELDGEYDNPDPVAAEVAEGVGDLPEGDRGKAGESCTLLRVADDEWEVVGVGGRPRKSRGVRWEQDDIYSLTAADISAGSATMPLSHRPANEALTCVLAGVPQRPTAWTINYDAKTLTMPLSGWEKAGLRLWVHYAYRRDLSPTNVLIPFGDTGWSVLSVTQTDATDRSAPAFDDSTWASQEAPVSDSLAPHPVMAGWLVPASTGFAFHQGLWVRRDVTTLGTGGSLTVRYDDWVEVYWNGSLIGSDTRGTESTEITVDVPTGTGADVLAIHLRDYGPGPGRTYFDAQLSGVPL